LRHAWAIVDLAPKSEVETLLAPLTDPASDWKYSAREVLAYSDYHNGNTKQATAAYKSLADNAKTPANLRQRAKVMESFLESGGGADVGSVPPAPPGAVTPNNAQPSGTPSP
jgi:hypothetical protein